MIVVVGVGPVAVVVTGARNREYYPGNYPRISASPKEDFSAFCISKMPG
jgi:hypothetical protein